MFVSALRGGSKAMVGTMLSWYESIREPPPYGDSDFADQRFEVSASNVLAYEALHNRMKSESPSCCAVFLK
jgi:hypothetical protein